MKLWKARTATSTQNRPLLARHPAEPLSSFFSAGGTAAVSPPASGTVSVNRSGLQLASDEDHEGLGPRVFVGQSQIYVDGVAVRRKGVKPRPGAAGQL